VFVADSQRYRMNENRDNLKSLASYLRRMGNDPAYFPLIIQTNKQDLPNVWRPDQLTRFLGTNGVPHFSSVATRGDGVFETLKAIINVVVQRIH
jgi:signal recognition particle receptor subunit beta